MSFKNIKSKFWISQIGLDFCLSSIVAEKKRFEIRKSDFMDFMEENKNKKNKNRKKETQV